MRDAIESYEDAIKLGPDDWVEPRLRLGELCIKDEQGAKAVRTIEEALKIKPKDPRVIQKLGIAIAISGDNDGGFKKFIEGTTLEQDNMDYHPDIRKLVDKNGGLIELAITEQRKDVEAHPDDVEAKIKLARLLNIVSRLDQAQKELEAAREKKASDPEISFVLADVLHRRHDEKESASAFAQGCRDETADKPAAPSEQKYLPTYEDGLEEERLNKEEVASAGQKTAGGEIPADEKPAEEAAEDKPAQPAPVKGADEE
jgi:Flp pilus assembly protein TadD